MTNTAEKAVPSFSLDAFEASDTGKMQVLDAVGNPTGWFWEFAGPGHPKTEAINNRFARERLHKQQQIEQAQVNGRKWKADQEIPPRSGPRTLPIWWSAWWAGQRSKSAARTSPSPLRTPPTSCRIPSASGC